MYLFAAGMKRSVQWASGTKVKQKERLVVKIKLLLAVFRLDGIMKGIIHRKSEYLETKKILDTIRNRIAEARTGTL